MPRRKRSLGARAEVKQTVCKKVSRSPLSLFNVEVIYFIPVTTVQERSSVTVHVGSFQLNFSVSQVLVANGECEAEDETIPCLRRALVLLEDGSVCLATWEDFTLQLLSITEGIGRELLWAMLSLYCKGMTLHLVDCSGLLRLFPCEVIPGRGDVTVSVVVSGGLLVCVDPCEVPRSSFKERIAPIRELMFWLHPSGDWLNKPAVEGYGSSWNVAIVIDEFYRCSKLRMCMESFDWYKLNVKGVGHGVAEKMFSVLRPYQWRAVGWMLAREGEVVSGNTSTRIEDELSTIWTKLPSMDRQVAYYNNHTGRFCRQLLPPGEPLAMVSGGILADEMGLGKTVEVLALILANQWKGSDRSVVQHLQEKVQPVDKERPAVAMPTASPIFVPPVLDIKKEIHSENSSSSENHIVACVCGAMTTKNYEGAWVSCDACQLWYHATCVKFDTAKQQDFVCVRCLYSPDNPVTCGSTLIVSPISIAEQWLTEIDKHIKPGILKVLHYRGIKLDGYITPPEMASYDIVLTTYEVLKTEVYFSDNLKEFSRVLRHPKKYLPPRTPLSLLHWWRICLDEAQMIEGKYTNAARMVQQLSASHRWCVTGTPLQQGVHDLYGLLFFLRVEPYVADAWWKKLLWQPFAEGNWAPMLKACCKLLWRNSKQDVSDELKLPPHSECVHWLNFSPVERHFYRKTLEQCSDQFEAMVQRFCDDEQALCSFDNNTVSMLLSPLRQLRRACCHPQLVKGGYLVGTNNSRGHVTMAKLLDQLTKKAQNDVIEALRVLVTSCNGIAGVHQIKHQWQEAADMYHHVIQLWEEHTNDVIGVDRLPRIHTLENLADLLEAEHCSISGRTLRDDNLRSEAKELREQYLKKFTGTVTVSMSVFQSAKDQCVEAQRKLSNVDYWWDNALNWSCGAGLADKLVNAVVMEMDSVTSHSQFLIRNISGLQLLLVQEAGKLEERREEALELMSDLVAMPTAVEVEEAAACHLRPSSPVSFSLCKFCEADQVIEKLHDAVYMRMVYSTGEEYSSQADGFLERLLKGIQSFVRYHGGSQDITDEAKDYFALLEAFKKEYKAIKEVWLASHRLVAALDELDMGTTKMQLACGFDDTASSLHILDTHEVEPTLFRLQLEKTSAEQDLKKLLGQLLYLNNLHKVSDVKGENPEPCPICVKPLGYEWSMLTCGHCLCTDCCEEMLRHHRLPVVVQWLHHPHRVGSIQCPLCRETCHSEEIGLVSNEITSNEVQMQDLKIEGSFSTKIKGIILAVLSIRKDHPDVKMIIFSMWSESLDLVSQGLKQNGVRFFHGKDQKSMQKSLHQFKEDQDTKVLLLPTHYGSKGLNLTEASHVILCEPSLNMADEHQAIGRVYRMGQTRPTVVHRLYIKDSVEENIRALIPPSVTSDVQKQAYGNLTLQNVRELLRS